MNCRNYSTEKLSDMFMTFYQTENSFDHNMIFMKKNKLNLFSDIMEIVCGKLYTYRVSNPFKIILCAVTYLRIIYHSDTPI